MKQKEIQTKLKTQLKSSRYEHTLGVAYTAASMAMKYDIEMRDAFLAGLLHDCAKGYSIEEQIKLCLMYGIEVTDDMKQSPQLIHQTLGAVLAKEEYDVRDEQIISAISVHTTGKPCMSLLDKIIFIADYIEPNRKMIEGLSRARKLAFEDIDACMCVILKGTIDYLKSRNQHIDMRTLETYQYYQTGE